MASYTILTIEDDSAIRRGIVDSLTYYGYRVIEAADGVLGKQLAVTGDYDLLLLDLALPGLPGMSILKAVRDARPTQPIIVLTAKGDETDRITGLKNGADDYVVKPFSVKELVARVEAVLRRSPERPRDIESVAFDGGVVDFARQEIRHGDERVELSEREVDLLRYLASHRGRAISREELLSNVWRITPQGTTTRTIDMHIARLREKLRDDPSHPQLLLTVRGKGYMFR
ncbi:MAG TPA: response regulator transcription factor [Pirellulaceae bacterium]|nr:response regulator transcription factor [Pirellulaceae bacterium]HMO92039.1 response regulator transcription factor [Pirellulaceae bacterium]HMP68838.1 response regulator transcription factor [Pirellulaceae bacterium]